MNNTIARGYDSEVVESLFTPLEESKSFLVAAEFKLFIFFFRVSISGEIYLDRVVDN
jgi:hypothetical protein